jgi:hypothetical protein
MRVRVEIVDEKGSVVSDGIFDAPLLRIGGDESDDIRIAGLPTWAADVRVEGDRVTVTTGKTEYVVQEAMTFHVRDVSIRVTPHPATLPSGCPRCRAPMRDHAVGGAYRSMARREHVCTSCGVTLVELTDAAMSIGAFVDLSRNEWVAVIVPQPCLRCRQLMVRSVFRTDHGEAQVERCPPCGLVLLDPTDRARLAGRAE